MREKRIRNDNSEQRFELVAVVVNEVFEVVVAFLLNVVDVVLGLDGDLLEFLDPRDVCNTRQQHYTRDSPGAFCRVITAANLHAAGLLFEPFAAALDPLCVGLV